MDIKEEFEAARSATIAALEETVRAYGRSLEQKDEEIKKLRSELAAAEFRLAVLARLQEVSPTTKLVQ